MIFKQHIHSLQSFLGLLLFGIRFPKNQKLDNLYFFSHFFCIIGGGMRVRECKYKNMWDTLQQGGRGWCRGIVCSDNEMHTAKRFVIQTHTYTHSHTDTQTLTQTHTHKLSHRHTNTVIYTANL